MVGQQPLLDLLGPHRTGGHDDHQRRQRVPLRLGLDDLEQRAGEGVTDDDRHVDPFVVDGGGKLRREVLARGQQDEATSLGEYFEGSEHAGPMHERAGGEQGQARSVLGHGA